MVPRIAVMTGTRADYGLLYWLLYDLRASDKFDLKLIVSGMHLAPAFGNTVEFIRADGFSVDAEVDCLNDDDSFAGMGRAYVSALDGFLNRLQAISPDILIILGDRFEALAAATAATMLRIPIGHIHGGEVTTGAIDDTFRHAITKMAHLHFTAAVEYANRIIQMGEQPKNVVNVGAIGLDNFARLPLLDKSSLAKRLGLQNLGSYALVTYHSVTDVVASPETALLQLFAALDDFHDLTLIVTKANADPGGRRINAILDDLARSNGHRMRLATSLGQSMFLSAMKHADVVIGNSSSGIIEAPAVYVPTINIGNRQSGRLKARSILDVPEQTNAIKGAVKMALQPAFRQSLEGSIPPYGLPNNATNKIIEVLSGRDFSALNPKFFCDLTR